MNELTGHVATLSGVALKTALMFLTALVGLRLSERRTLAQMSPFDFVGTVAMGAIIGKTVITPSNSYAQGALALAALMAMHRLVSLLRLRPLFARLVDHRLRVLVRDGRVLRRQMVISGLTDYDLMTQLRLKGVRDLADVRYALYEPKGGITVVTTDAEAAAPLVAMALPGPSGATPPDHAGRS